MNNPTGIIDIRGKQYQTVALRVQMFRDKCPEHGLSTEVVERDADCVVVRAMIVSPDGRILATGHAEEYRKSSQINRTSALENAETSAIGRALAAFGFGGTEFATANEVQNAIHQQEQAGRGDAARSEVSPPTAKQPKHSALKTAYRGFVHELNGCGDGDEISAFLATPDSLKLVKEIRDKLPHIWDGTNWPADVERPEQFETLSDTISRRQRECAERSAEYARV